MLLFYHVCYFFITSKYAHVMQAIGFVVNLMVCVLEIYLVVVICFNTVLKSNSVLLLIDAPRLYNVVGCVLFLLV